MLTYEEALNAQHFESLIHKNRDGSRLRARRNGKTKTWKTRSEQFEIPLKHGLKCCFRVNETEAKDWVAV